MIFEGEREIPSPKERLWKFLTNLESLASVIPGLQTYELIGEDTLIANVKAGVGPIKQVFKVKGKIVEKKRDSFAKLEMQGSASSGFFDLKSAMELMELSQDRCKLKWVTEVNIGGLIASLGSKILSNTAEKIVNELFNNITKKVCS